MTLQLLHSEFPYIWEKILFSFLSVYLYQKDEPEGVDPAGSGRADRRSTAQQTRGQGISGENSFIESNPKIHASKITY